MVVLEIKGKQYPAEEGLVLRVDHLGLEEGSQFSDIKVLLHKQDGKTSVGQPYLDNIKVTSKVEKNFKDKKVRVVHYKPKKDIRSLQGHRQPYTSIKIEKIEIS